MKFSELVEQVRPWLEREGRVSYRALKREFDLDDEYLEDLKAELIDAKRVAVDEDGKVLVWTGKETEGEKAKRGNGKTGEDIGPRTPDTGRSDGERRQLTLMLIDLAGSTTLSHQLDPEHYHSRVETYQTACHHTIARNEAHIAQYLGDGVLVYFGYPAAHEEDTVRAVRSGLEIVTAVSQLTFTPSLQVRIGIHTGPVVVGEIGAGERTEWLALGETPNIAARVQGVAEPDTVVVSAATHRLVYGLFESQDLGPQALKGISAPMVVYRIRSDGTGQ